MTDQQPLPAPEAQPSRFVTTAPDGHGHADGGAAAEAFAIDLARLMHDDKCTQVSVLDVRGLSPITNFLVIGSGTSERQMRSVMDHAVDLAAEQRIEPYRLTKDAGAHWLIADFVDVVVHLFEPNTRAHYDLEMLWGDAREVPWQRPGERRPAE
ncbi:MAG TPA: ribosome silencing factor [Phycisphaerales bacterium]|nr:ribosome silencing factor [Phycisphaerales bacterium]